MEAGRALHPTGAGLEIRGPAQRLDPKRSEQPMNVATASERTHCLAPSRVRSARHAVTGPTTYARMLPALPTLDADEQMLNGIGRAGGPCDCTDDEDLPESLGDEAAGWPIFG